MSVSITASTLTDSSSPRRASGEPATSPANERPWAIASLPPFPAVALQLMSLLDDQEAPMRQVVNLLRVDPALSAEILRVANSALYGLSGRIANVSHAVVVLGSDSVRRLALTVALGRFSSRFLRDPTLRSCWDHSVASAMSAEAVAELLNQPKDRAYTTGLLHEVGRLALLACHPDKYRKLLAAEVADESEILEREREIFDIDHCTAGSWLARHWKLPQDMTEAISSQSAPWPSDASLVTIVGAASQIADALGFFAGPRTVDSPPSVAETLERLAAPDHDRAVESFDGFDQTIRSAIATVSPAAR